jgi:hypothetical protein
MPMLSDVKIQASGGEPSGDLMNTIHSVAVMVDGECVSFCGIDSRNDRINYRELGRIYTVMQRLGHKPYIIARDSNCGKLYIESFWLNQDDVLNIVVQ